MENITATNRLLQVARIKGAEEYHWFKYKGVPMLVGTKRRGELRKGDIIGMRYSSNKRDVRLVTLDRGLTQVFTLSDKEVKHLEHNTEKVPTP